MILLWHISVQAGVCVCVFYYCRTYYKAVRVGGGGEWRTCAMRDDEPRPVWMSLPITHLWAGVTHCHGHVLALEMARNPF